MATTTKIYATASRYGNAGQGSYSQSGRLYVGTNDNGSNYRARITFPTIRSAAAIGDNNIIITKVTLTVRRDSGYKASTVTAGASADGNWGAVCDGTASLNIPAKTAWYTFDITNCAEAILNYSGNWYVHLTSSGTQARFNGIDDLDGAGKPYINVVWEYSANTLTTDVESVELGKEVHLNIAPEDGDASYALTYEFGDESGIIAETSDTSIAWTPPAEFALELPDADNGEVKITMKVYDAEGKQKRTEVLYLTITVPETAVPTIADMGISLVNDLGGYALTGKTYAVIAPTIDINDTYGASIKSVVAILTDGVNSQTITWDALTEADAGVFSGAAQNTNIIYNAGEAIITITVADSRGREVVQTHVINVQTYANPLITVFSVERYEPVYDADEQISGYAPSDTGENVWVSIKARCSDILGLNAVAWRITAKTVDGEVTYTGTGNGTEIDISNDRGIITAVVPAASAVEYTLTVADTAGYVSYQYDNVTPGRANFALAGSKYGASFGCMPKGTEAQPMLESAYPIYAYGGIEGVTNYTTEEVKTGGTWIDGKPIYRRVVTATGNIATDTALTTEKINGIDTLVNIVGSLLRTDGTRMTIPAYSATNYSCSCEVDNTNTLKFYKGTSITTSYIQVAAYYTKVMSEVTAYASGNPVSFNAVAGSVILPTTTMKMRQSGSGEASPENVRKIMSYDVLKLNHHGADEASTLRTYSVNVGNAVCCGSFDWTSGKLTMDYGFYKLDGTVKPYEATVIGESTRAGFNVLPFKAMEYVSGNTDGAFSHGKYLMSWGSESTHAYANGWTVIITMPTALVGSTIDSFAEYLAAQNAAGTPLQIAYKLLETNVIQLAAQQITALTPYQTNVLYGDGDTINVEYTKWED